MFYEVIYMVCVCHIKLNQLSRVFSPKEWGDNLLYFTLKELLDLIQKF